MAGIVITAPAAPSASTTLLVGPEGVEERAIHSLAVEWNHRQTDPDNGARLAEACENFVRHHPTHPRAFNYHVRGQDLRGSRDLDALGATLDAAADKSITQFAHNTISFANLCFREGRFDEALARYEAALSMPICPPDRRGEAGMMMGTILRRTKHDDRARQAFQEARRHTERFPAIEAEIALIDLDSGNQPTASALGTSVNLRDPGATIANREQEDPLGAPAFRDHEIHDRGMTVHVLSPGCHDEHTVEIGVEKQSTPWIVERWPQSGSRTVSGLAWLSKEAFIIRGSSVPLFDTVDDREMLRAGRWGWNGTALIAGPLVESGAIEGGCDGG